jgi:hypothetical protein
MQNKKNNFKINRNSNKKKLKDKDNKQKDKWESKQNTESSLVEILN